MKKLLSFILACLMVFSVSAILLTTATAAAASMAKTWTFDESTLSSKTNSSLLNAIGWSTVSANYPSTLKASVSSGALRLQNASNSRIDLLVHTHEDLKKGYTLEYDFMYSAKSNLPAAVGSYTQYNSKADESAHFSGSKDTGDSSTWHVQPRINGNLLNSPKNNSNSWVDTSKMTPNYASTVLGKWFTVRIEFSPENGVSVFVKAKGATVWSRTDSYSAATLNVAKTNTSSFVTQYLRLSLRNYVDVNLDNIKISEPNVLPTLVGYQVAGSNSTYTLRLITAIGDKDGSKVGYQVKMTSYDKTTGVRSTATKNVDCNYVYRSITYKEGTKTVTATAEQLCPGTNYLYALHIENIPNSVGYTYEVTPYMVKDKETLYGNTASFGYADFAADVPVYSTAGTVSTAVEFSAGGHFTTQVEGTSKTEFDAYVSKLTQAGYTLYQSRDNVNGNYFRTLYNDTNMVHVYYMPSANTGGDFSKNVARIVVSDVPKSEAFAKEAYGDAAVTDGSMTFMSIDYTKQGGGNNGLGVIFTNPDGSYVIVDGGWKYDTTAFYNFLKENNKRTDGKIVIRAWIITHPHEDHWGNFVEFASRYSGAKGYDGQSYNYSDVKVEYFVAQLNQQYCNANAQVYNGSKLIREAAVKFGAKTIVPHTGQVMYFGELQVEFLYTLETMLNQNTVEKYIKGVDGNEQSIVLRAKFATGQSVLVTGDATKNESTHLDVMYKTHLKSDFVTLPHHGIDETTSTFYETHIKPKYALVPTSAEQTASRYNNYKNKTGSITKAIDYVTANGGAYYAADDGYRTFVIEG
ncbi:MAG: MBL fold metallo-hydrolase [Clostridia bacterium]|nr:MBL fold metallo-hydrolase [Clostridia bacterium]